MTIHAAVRTASFVVLGKGLDAAFIVAQETIGTSFQVVRDHRHGDNVRLMHIVTTYTLQTAIVLLKVHLREIIWPANNLVMAEAACVA